MRSQGMQETEETQRRLRTQETEGILGTQERKRPQETLKTQETQDTKRRAKAIKEESGRTLRLTTMKGVTAKIRRPAKWAMIEWVME